MAQSEGPKPPDSIRIVVVAPTSWQYMRAIVRGAGKYCAEHGIPAVHYDMPPDAPPMDPRAWGADGVVLFASTEQGAKIAQTWQLPVVNVSTRLADLGLPVVSPDHPATGEMGAAHLLSRGLRELAYFGVAHYWYSIGRQEGFERKVRAAGLTPRVFLDQASLFAWIKSVHPDRTAGLMCSNDHAAKTVCEQCRRRGWRVPQDVALIGVDNDDLLCHLNDPPLSTVDVNSELIGYTAARLVHRRIEHGEPIPPLTITPPRSLIIRKSTATEATDDPLVAEAVAYMWEHGNDSSISVSSIANDLAVSRRNLERRFAAALGKTVGDQLTQIQFEHAQRLLIDTDMSVDRAAEASGLRSERQMRRVFLKLAGMTPLEFRKSRTRRTSAEGTT